MTSYAVFAYWPLLFPGPWPWRLRIAVYSGKVECALKSLSITRMELQAAILGVRLKKMICQAQRLPINECFYHMDYMNVLAWIMMRMVLRSGEMDRAFFQLVGGSGGPNSCTAIPELLNGVGFQTENSCGEVWRTSEDS